MISPIWARSANNVDLYTILSSTAPDNQYSRIKKFFHAAAVHPKRMTYSTVLVWDIERCLVYAFVAEIDLGGNDAYSVDRPKSALMVKRTNRAKQV